MSARQLPLKHWGWTAALAILLCAPAARADLQARLSKNPVYVSDTLTLTLTSDAQGDAGQPDLSPLQRDFEVLGTATSSQLSIINGRTSALSQWQVQLQPRHSGALTIPALQLGSQHSQPLAVKVTDSPPPEAAAAAAETARHLFVETGLDSAATPYVQQQVVYSVRLYYDDTLREGTLTEPQLTDAVIEKLGDDRRSSATRNGRQYQVLERRYAVFPQKSGVIEIPAVRFEGRMAGRDRDPRTATRAGSLIERFLQNSPFANDPFFQDGPFGAAGQPVRAFGPALKLTVRPRPASPGPWLPARAVRLHDSWADAPPKLRVGEPVSRIITVEADGLSGPQIPSLDLPAPATLRMYRDPAETATHSDSDRLVGVSRQTLTYIPDGAGEVEIPAVTLGWWDTSRDASASTTLPAWHLAVAPGTGGQRAQPPAQAATPAAAGAAPVASQPVDDTGPAHAAWRDALSARRTWLAIAGMLLVALLTAARIRRRRRAVAATGKPLRGASAEPGSLIAAPAVDQAALLHALESACRERDAMQAARTLLALAAARWPDRAPRNLGDLAARLGTGAEAVRALDRYLYASASGSWPAEALWAAVQNGLQGHPEPTQKRSSDDLPPLYPHQA